MIVIYSLCNPSNQYSIIDDIVVAENSIDISTTSKIPDMPKLTCCYRRYIYIVDKEEFSDASIFSFSDTSSRFGDTDESAVVKWFNEWCQS